MDRFCHSCYYKNTDGTNKIIAAGENCLLRTNKCFWKDPCDVSNGVKTRSRAKSELTVNFRAVDRCNKEKYSKTIDNFL